MRYNTERNFILKYINYFIRIRYLLNHGWYINIIDWLVKDDICITKKHLLNMTKQEFEEFKNV